MYDFDEYGFYEARDRRIAKQDEERARRNEEKTRAYNEMVRAARSGETEKKNFYEALWLAR